MAGSGGERCLVIGGAGMLGYDIVTRLISGGHDVRVLDLAPVEDDRIELLLGDIRNAEQVNLACSGVDVVFQTAAAVWNPRLPRSNYAEVNIGGNRNVIEACRRNRVRRLVFTSSMDVVVDGRKPIVQGDESLQYPSRPPADIYSRTKIEAEKLILSANGLDLATCVLRPAGMYGPRDKYHLPNVIDLARKGRNIRVGNGQSLFSHVYSENVAQAHLLAASRLYPGSPIAGESYFITDDTPDENLFDFVAPFLEELGLPRARRSIPYLPAYLLASIVEFFFPRSRLCRFSVVQTCVHHTFVHTKATRDFGYTPEVPPDEAFRRTATWFRKWYEQLNGANPRRRSAPSRRTVSG
ncbi:MAG TPA: NAD-dependent epimerase/dehydratase family protein [Spirochaetia bacterium]|nr:NAD-dependent epimerase/dehydratase family protein [Spirochaetia bacterium]